MLPAARTMDDNRRRDNLRTGILLACVAAVFFLGFIAKFYLAR